ncbi:hypothetical protein L0222_21920 [bacterium]|nr:hypothetical protein [bacterium]
MNTTMKQLLFRVLTIMILFRSQGVSEEIGKDDVHKYVWDLSAIYQDDRTLEKERALIQSKLETIRRIKGTLGRNAKSLADGLDEVSDLRTRAHKISVYGELVSALDTRSTKAQQQYEIGSAFETQVEAALSFVIDELRAVGAARLNQWLVEEPRLAVHRRRILKSLREAPHTLAPESQSILRSMARLPQLTADAYLTLLDSNLGWTEIMGEDGKSIVVDNSNYRSLTRSLKNEVRIAAANAYLARLGKFEDLFGMLLTRRIETDLTIAKYRNFKDGIDALFFLRDGMPEGSYNIMLNVARNNLALYHRYIQLCRRALDLDRVNYSDIRNLPPGKQRFTVRESMEIIIEASAPLGTEFQNRMRERLLKPWLHLPPLPEKRGIYAIFPPVGGIPPFTIMSYRGDQRSSRQLAGAVMFMMYSADIPKDRFPETRYDPPIYGNGLIYLGNILYYDYLKDLAGNRKDRIELLLQQLDRITNQFFHWNASAEFESKIQDMIRNGEPPTGPEISKMYLDILRRYYGHHQGGAAVDEIFAADWIIAEVSFSSYEHLFWPPAMAAACLLMEKLKAGDPNARKATYQVVGRGDSDLSYDLLLQAGIDMAKPEPYEALIRRMNMLMDELERLLDEKK